MADVFKIGASSIAGGGGVGGASNLTTVGAVPYVSASGVLNQDGSFLRVSTGQYTLYDPTATTGSTLATITPGAAQTSSSTVLAVGGTIKFGGSNATGAGTALLSTNSPATTNTAPYTWIKIITADGSTAYIPCWK